MLDDATTPPAGPEPRCMWCSAILPSNHETTCPSCGATLVGEGDTSVPGLTAIDADAILRNARTASRPRPRGGRLLSWISGEYTEDDAGESITPGSLSPPPADVRREMLRLELEAQVANAQAEAESLAADAAVEDGTRLTGNPEEDLGVRAPAPESAPTDASEPPAS
ncbi:MAG TPA: hypothetical protein VIK65_07570 [Candidatus Limnocylindrales bacterium]|jgi:hypothetical protein